MLKQLFLLITFLLFQLISAGPAPEQPIGENNPEFGRGRGGGDEGRGRGRWTWCRCRAGDRWDDGRWDGRWDGRGERREL